MAPQESKESKLLASKTKEEGKIIQKVIFTIIYYAYIIPRVTSARHLPKQSICLHKEFVSAFYFQRIHPWITPTNVFTLLWYYCKHIKQCTLTCSFKYIFYLITLCWCFDEINVIIGKL